MVSYSIMPKTSTKQFLEFLVTYKSQIWQFKAISWWNNFSLDRLGNMLLVFPLLKFNWTDLVQKHDRSHSFTIIEVAEWIILDEEDIFFQSSCDQQTHIFIRIHCRWSEGNYDSLLYVIWLLLTPLNPEELPGIPRLPG